MINRSCTAIRKLIGIAGEGKKLLEDSLVSLNSCLETINVELKNVNNDLNETLNFRKDIHKLELLRMIIEKNKERTPTNYHNLHHFYDLFNCSTNNSIDILRKATNDRQIRPLVQNITEKIKAGVSSSVNGNKELEIDLKKLRSNGLKKDHSILEAFEYYLEFTPLEELERKVKPELPAIITGNNIICQLHKNISNKKQ